MNILLFGATGMIGKGVLLECLDDARVASVVAIVRSPIGMSHPKLVEIEHRDFLDFAAVRGRFAGIDACFFCLGVSSVGMTDADYTRITHDFTVAAARCLREQSPNAVFCFITGRGTDSTERSGAMWARVKGRAENAVLAMGFPRAYMVRPAFIQPMKGARSKTGWYHVLYVLFSPLSSLLVAMAPAIATTTERVGRAMIVLATRGFARPIVEAADINDLAGK